MSIDSIEFINVAQKNLEQNKSEIGCRTAVSRAYYGMYHSCIELTGPVPKHHPLNGVLKGGSHSRLAQYMTECAELISPEKQMEVRKLGVKLKMYHKYRCDADYELNKSVTQKSAEIVISESRNLVSCVNSVKSSVV
ncbi:MULTISPECIES: HEPN domain-containing protein [Citrobacter freundii complex]|uniref:HEPN domain-containing protein n=1 Tax=Citrobacter freundii complex TaxID=1344959 RepID=UPI00065A3992|nr:MULTISPECIES: HEPN domain-containing protein [Citrobacter freundii complex]KLV69668.1 hypothetical protein SK38_03315 [Citrobacter sp. MGH110]NTY84022.1 HEPN domain-containing protein [Citrobacter werkmanii]